jgi:hypothetical protein
MIKKLFSLLFGSKKTEKTQESIDAVELPKETLNTEIAKIESAKEFFDAAIKTHLEAEAAKKEAPVVKKRAPKKKVTAETEAANVPAEKPKAKRAPRKKTENGETVEKPKRAPRNLKPKSE